MFLRRFLRLIVNKYFLTTLAFIIWMVFFDSNNMLTRRQLKRNLKGLQQEKQFYLDEIMRDSLLSQRLLNDSATLEQYAREKFLMKRPDEDLYLIVDSQLNQDPR